MNYCFDLTQIVVAAIATIGASSFITVKVVNRNNTKINKTNTQSGNTVTNGDIVGGNKTTKS